MDHKSKYFDKIRINKGRKKDSQPNNGICQWNGCENPGTHKAPLGRDREGQYLMFCINHVREYNKCRSGTRLGLPLTGVHHDRKSP